MRADLNEVVSQLKSGNKERFNDLYKMTYKVIYPLIHTILQDRHETLDAMQETYINAYKSIHTLENPSMLFPWLKRIAVNVCKNMLKKKKRSALFINSEQENIILSIESESREYMIPQIYVENKLKRKQILEIVNTLPQPQRLSIILYYYAELDTKEIADIMECSPSTVSTRIVRGRDKIKIAVEALERKGDKLYTLVPITLFIEAIQQDIEIPRQIISPPLLLRKSSKLIQLIKMKLIIPAICLTVGIIMLIPAPAEENYIIEWKEPIIESMVRNRLGIQQAPIYSKDIENITEINIFGHDEIYLTHPNFAIAYDFEADETFYTYMYIDGDGVKQSSQSIADSISLTDLEHFVNLTHISIYSTRVENIDVLNKLTSLRSIHLYSVPLNNIDWLIQCENVAQLILSNTGLENADYLTERMNLEYFSIEP